VGAQPGDMVGGERAARAGQWLLAREDRGDLLVGMSLGAHECDRVLVGAARVARSAPAALGANQSSEACRIPGRNEHVGRLVRATPCRLEHHRCGAIQARASTPPAAWSSRFAARPDRKSSRPSRDAVSGRCGCVGPGLRAGAPVTRKELVERSSRVRQLFCIRVAKEASAGRERSLLLVVRSGSRQQ